MLSNSILLSNKELINLCLLIDELIHLYKASLYSAYVLINFSNEITDTCSTSALLRFEVH